MRNGFFYCRLRIADCGLAIGYWLLAIIPRLQIAKLSESIGRDREDHSDITRLALRWLTSQRAFRLRPFDLLAAAQELNSADGLVQQTGGSAERLDRHGIRRRAELDRVNDIVLLREAKIRRRGRLAL